jgi:hypothetical protein
MLRHRVSLWNAGLMQGIGEGFGVWRHISLLIAVVWGIAVS